MPDSSLSVVAERLASSRVAAELALRLFPLATNGDSTVRFLELALAEIRSATKAEFVAVTRGERGHWKTLASAGRDHALPVELMADVLDEGTAREALPWSAVSLSRGESLGEVLALYSSTRSAMSGALEEIGVALGWALGIARRNDQQRQRLQRLETLLDVTSQWNKTLDLSELLTQIAEAATRLLAAERASLFLWDRQAKILVGRPALGVPGNELRVPDNKGIVGQVVQTGESRRVDSDETSAEINRSVDKQLGFKTRNLLCVPLRQRGGELFGAFEVINKKQGNFDRDDEIALVEMAAHAAIALENSQQYEQLLKARNQLVDQAAANVQMVGKCPALAKLRTTIDRVASTELTVLILGENGTGKEVVSQLIHYGSSRRREPFIAVNCAALTETLLESELFGHEKGAFTDARETRAGKFELASGGTLFLDEIGDMSLNGQAKLLRVLEEKVVVRVGGSLPVHTDARVIAATNQNLAELVRAKKFREDLFFRLNVVTLQVPPLRERGDDVLALAEHFLAEFSGRARRKTPQFSTAARNRLLSHTWPGNVRELRNLMERIAYLCPQEKIEVDDLAFVILPPANAVGGIGMSLDEPLSEATQKFQTDYITRQIEAAGGNMTIAAERLGLQRTNLYRKMKQLGMPTQDH